MGQHIHACFRHTCYSGLDMDSVRVAWDIENNDGAMIKSLDKKQLATILGITQKNARKKIIVALNRKNGAVVDLKHQFKRLDETTPDDCPIDRLAESMNLPGLPRLVERLYSDFLSNPASRKFIIDYPMQVVEEKAKSGQALISIRIPAEYRRLISEEVQKEIVEKWKERYPHYQEKFRL